MFIQKITHWFTRGISVIFHPLLLPSWTFLYLSGLASYQAMRIAPARRSFFLLIFISTFLIPGVMMFMLKTMRVIESLHMDDRKERTLPFLLTAFIYYFSYRYFQRLALPDIYLLMMLSATAMIITAMIINLKWKISIHMMGIGGVCGMFHALSPHYPHVMFIPVVIVTAVAGIIAFSRLHSGSHRPSEVYVGFITGYLLFFILFAISG